MPGSEENFMNAYYDPYRRVGRAAGRWYKCNFHAHDEIGYEKVVGLYETGGYDILMVHGNYADGGRGGDSGIKIFGGEEYLEKDGILLVGAAGPITGSPQRAIDACTAGGGFSIVCHPNLVPSENCPEEKLLMPGEIATLTGLSGVEIINGCLIRAIERGEGIGEGIATDVWDMLLSAGKIIWGFGNDDFHGPETFGVAWNEIYSASGSLEDIRGAVRLGQCYASTGLKLSRYDFNGEWLEVEARNPLRDEPEIEYRFIGENMEILDVCAGTKARYRVTGREKYVRVEACGASGAQLWTQPLIRDHDETDIVI